MRFSLLFILVISAVCTNTQLLDEETPSQVVSPVDDSRSTSPASSKGSIGSNGSKRYDSDLARSVHDRRKARREGKSGSPKSTRGSPRPGSPRHSRNSKTPPKTSAESPRPAPKTPAESSRAPAKPVEPQTAPSSLNPKEEMKDTLRKVQMILLVIAAVTFVLIVAYTIYYIQVIKGLYEKRLREEDERRKTKEQRRNSASSSKGSRRGSVPGGPVNQQLPEHPNRTNRRSSLHDSPQYPARKFSFSDPIDEEEA